MEVVVSKSAIAEAIEFISSEVFVDRVRSFRRAHAHAFDSAAVHARDRGRCSDIYSGKDRESDGDWDREEKKNCRSSGETKGDGFHDSRVAESKDNWSTPDSKYSQSDAETYGAVGDRASYESVTHTVEMNIVFKEYTALLDGLLEGFLADRGVSVSAFLSECGDVLDGKFTPIFGEHEHLWFVELLQTWSSYAAFYEMMAAEARLARK
jgi:hypothetical protein